MANDQFESVPFWQLQIHWFGGSAELNLLFTHPPLRKHVAAIMQAYWRKTPIARQDQTWECILILAELPEHPWEGQIASLYGLIECRQLHLIDNENLDETPVP